MPPGTHLSSPIFVFLVFVSLFFFPRLLGFRFERPLFNLFGHISISCWFSPFRLAPRRDGGLREPTLAVRGRFLNGGVAYHSAFFVSTPRHAGGKREVFDGGLPYIRVCVSFNYFSSRFSWLHSQAV